MLNLFLELSIEYELLEASPGFIILDIDFASGILYTGNKIIALSNARFPFF